MWRRRDPVTPELRRLVILRDRACVAPRLGATDPCAGQITLDHIKDQPRMGKRAPSDLAHLVAVCWHHHMDGWATAHRPELREYLRGSNSEHTHVEPVHGCPFCIQRDPYPSSLVG